MANCNEITIKLDYSELEKCFLKRKLTEAEANIVKNEVQDHIESYTDEAVYYNSGVELIMRIWAHMDSILQRPMTEEELKIVMKLYTTNYRYSGVMNDEKWKETFTAIARSWLH